MTLTEELLEFLGSFKSAESMSPELRDNLGVDTKLEDCLLQAASDSRLVFVTGVAGSGKSHLLRSLSPPDGVRVVGPEEMAADDLHLMIVEDATPLDIKDRILLATSENPARFATIIAINEGPLRETGASKGGEAFKIASDLLHKGQRGQISPYDPAKPTILDMGAFDPVEYEAVAAILGKPELHEVVRDVPCDCGDTECPRKEAWKQLKNKNVRDRVGRLVKLILLEDSGWAFRDVWDFVADLVLEGNCEDDPPTSSWFWRLFNGSSLISQALKEVADPESVAIPGAEQRLWHADWYAHELELIDDLELQLYSRPDGDIDRFVWLKLQLLLMSQSEEEIHQLLYQTLEHKLVRAAKNREVGPIIQAINAYMNYDMIPTYAARLQLWVDHGTERRTERTHGQICVGTAAATKFTVSPSQVVINHPDPDLQVIGDDRFLTHSESGAFLDLKHEKLALLETRRTFRRADRRHTDLEWGLYSFFEVVLRKAASSHELMVLLCDFGSMKGVPLRYSISVEAGTIEQA